MEDSFWFHPTIQLSAPTGAQKSQSRPAALTLMLSRRAPILPAWLPPQHCNRPCHKGVGPGVGHAADVVHLDAAVHLQPDVFAAGQDAFARGLNLAQRSVDKALAAKTGVDAHDEDEVNVVNHPVQHVQRLRRVEHQAGLAAFGLDRLNAAVHMARGIGVKADEVGPGVGKRCGQRIHRLHHQVHVNRYGHAFSRFGMGLQRAANHRAKGEVGHVMVVHHVKMYPVASGGNHRLQFLPQAGKVGRQDGWRNAVGHEGINSQVILGLLAMIGHYGRFRS
jgi:hypothetical protein